MAVVAENEDLVAAARQLRNAGRLEEAEDACREALARRWQDAEGHRVLATILHQLGSDEPALTAFDESLRLDSRNPKTYKQLAAVLAEHGRLAEAMEAARAALELRPDYAAGLAVLASLKRFEAADDDDLVAMEELLRRGARDSVEAVLLHFALGNAYQEIGDFDRSFSHLREANALKRRTFDYDVAKDERFFERVASVFDTNLLESFAGAGSASEVPVLITGMPRSGTSLVEQILSSHPAVHGGGERTDLRELATTISLLAPGRGFPEGIANIGRDDLMRLGEGYAHRLEALAPGAARVTDKSPLNFAFLGLASLIVPPARIIHCVRDPLDTCVSCFSLRFESVPFSYDLAELGRYYRAYARLMEHWRRVLPEGWMLEVRYEDLVADIEGEARRLVDHCGLSWDDACLSFHATGRVVRTASSAQVRRPVYQSSIGRWRPYERHLTPLLEALGTDMTGARDAD